WATRDDIKAEGRATIEKAFAEIHGDTGVLLAWHVRDPMAHADALVKELAAGKSLPTGPTPNPRWRLTLSSGLDARVRLGPGAVIGDWLAYAEVFMPGDAKVDFFTAGSSEATVWVNGKGAHERGRTVPGPYPERFSAALAKGVNRIVVRQK